MKTAMNKYTETRWIKTCSLFILSQSYAWKHYKNINFILKFSSTLINIFSFLLNHILSHLSSFSSYASQENPFMLVQLPVSGQQ